MGRNFFNRIETAVLVEDKRLHQRILKETFNNYLADNARAWTLRSDGTYTRVTRSASARSRDAQQTLLDSLS